MKRFLSVLIVMILLVPCLAAAETTELSTAPLAFIQMLYQGEYEQVFSQSTADLQGALGSALGYAAVLTQLEQQFGAYEGILSDEPREQDGYFLGTIVCAYETADITFSVAVDQAGLLAGLQVIAATPKAPASSADQNQFITEDITLRPGEADETQGILTLPVSDEPFPAVIMLQGSGPSDRNETAYGIAPFRDIAEGLAQAGVASIRYDKYSFAHQDLLLADPALLADFTIELEYITDAREALALLAADERIGSIYLLGHSQGAMLIPRVMQALGADHFAGGVMLSGSPLPMWTLQYHQNLALISDMEQSQQVAYTAAIDAEAAKLADVLTLPNDELKTMTFFGISAYYQKDELTVDAAQAAIALEKPLLIVQGGKDWQVTPDDGMEQWKALLANQAFAEYLYYPNLNHMLCEMTGEAANDTSDYHAGDTVSQALIGDIADWILQ